MVLVTLSTTHPHEHHSFKLDHPDQSPLQTLPSNRPWQKWLIRIGVGAALLAGIGFCSPHSKPVQGDMVWVSGVQISQLEATRLIATEITNPAQEETATPQSTSDADQTKSAKVAELLLDRSSTEIAGNLSNGTSQYYALNAQESQLLTLTFEGNQVQVSVLNAYHQEIELFEFGDQIRLAQLPMSGPYFIQVSGVGDYSLNVTLND